jgi:hypothetical protein
VGNGDWTNFQTGLFRGQGSRHLFSTGDIYECFGSFKLIEFSNLTIHSLIGSSLATSEFIVVAQKI